MVGEFVKHVENAVRPDNSATLQRQQRRRIRNCRHNIPYSSHVFLKTEKEAGWSSSEARSGTRVTDRNAYIHRAWMRRGLPAHAFDGRPHIAIANTASDLTPCNAHLNEVADSVKHGVYEAGGIPLNLPVVSLGETQVRPTAMLWRNMAAMATEEMLRANPIDGVVLLGGCDKTIPSLLMAAASVDLPAVVVPGGPMLTGTFRGSRWVWHRRVAAQRRGPRRHAVRRGVRELRVVDDPQPRPLQHDGHRVDDGAASPKRSA